MSWAGRQRFIILSIFGAIILALLAVTLIATLYKAPSCTDHIQNQGEQGIDCGGPCPYLCNAFEQAPVVRFTKALVNGSGRTDVLAYVDNPNTNAAARGVPYHLVLYAADHTLIAQTGGVVDLPPSATVPVFIPGVATENRGVGEAFLTIDPTVISWYRARDTRVIPKTGSPVLGGTQDAPRITVTLTNPSPSLIDTFPTIVALFTATGDVIAASQTVVPSLFGGAHADAVFTWSAPFSQLPATIQVLPVIPLP